MIVYGDRGSGKSSVVVSLASWYARSAGERKIWYVDSGNVWNSIRDPAGSLDSTVIHIPVNRQRFSGDDGWKARLQAHSRKIHEDDWIAVDLQSDAWDSAQSYYWGQKSGNDSLAELWMKHAASEIAGDHGKNWGIINMFYHEWTNYICYELPCHLLMLAAATPIREPNERGKGGDDLDTRSYYGEIGMKMEGQKGLRGEGHTVIYAFEALGKYRYTTVKEMGPIGYKKRERLENKDVTERGFVPGYLIPVAGWRP